jgi:hemerythrin-like domain-containing protein
MLIEDHRKVKQLFQQFERADGRTKQEIVEKTIMELQVHSVLEEEIFYPALRQATDDETLNEAEEEHHVVDLLMGELMKMKPSDDHYDAKYTVLAENVKHHIEEEESEMLPKARQLGQDRLNTIGEQMHERKQKLMESMKGKPAPSTKSLHGRGRSTTTGTRRRTTTGRSTTASGSRSRR